MTTPIAAASLVAEAATVRALALGMVAGNAKGNFVVLKVVLDHLALALDFELSLKLIDTV